MSTCYRYTFIHFLICSYDPMSNRRIKFGEDLRFCLGRVSWMCCLKLCLSAVKCCVYTCLECSCPNIGHSDNGMGYIHPARVWTWNWANWQTYFIEVNTIHRSHILMTCSMTWLAPCKMKESSIHYMNICCVPDLLAYFQSWN